MSPTPYRVDRLTDDVWWIAFTTTRTKSGRGQARTAIVTGAKPKDWKLLRFVRGWPAPEG